MSDILGDMLRYGVSGSALKSELVEKFTSGYYPGSNIVSVVSDECGHWKQGIPTEEGMYFVYDGTNFDTAFWDASRSGWEFCLDARLNPITHYAKPLPPTAEVFTYKPEDVIYGDR